MKTSGILETVFFQQKLLNGCWAARGGMLPVFNSENIYCIISLVGRAVLVNNGAYVYCSVICLAQN